MMYEIPCLSIVEPYVLFLLRHHSTVNSIPNGEYPKPINVPAYVPPYETFPDPPPDNHLPATIQVTVGDEIALNHAVASFIIETRSISAQIGDVWRVVATDSENGVIIERGGRSVEVNKSLALTLQPVRIIR